MAASIFKLQNRLNELAVEVGCTPEEQAALKQYQALPRGKLCSEVLNTLIHSQNIDTAWKNGRVLLTPNNAESLLDAVADTLKNSVRTGPLRAIHRPASMGAAENIKYVGGIDKAGKLEAFEPFRMHPRHITDVKRWPRDHREYLPSTGERNPNFGQYDYSKPY